MWMRVAIKPIAMRLEKTINNFCPPYLKSATMLTYRRHRQASAACGHLPSIALKCAFGLCYVLSGVAQCGVECGRILDVYVVLKVAGSKNAMSHPYLGLGLGAWGVLVLAPIGRCGRVVVVEE
jgi:hypothetical protein